MIEYSPISCVIWNGGVKINSIENLSGLNSSGGISFEVTLAKRSTLAFCILGIEVILNDMK